MTGRIVGGGGGFIIGGAVGVLSGEPLGVAVFSVLGAGLGGDKLGTIGRRFDETYGLGTGELE